MNEPLSEVIRIRVTPSHAARLGEAAALSGLSLSNCIRRRLAADDTQQEELTLLRQIVADLGQRRDHGRADCSRHHPRSSAPRAAPGDQSRPSSGQDPGFKPG